MQYGAVTAALTQRLLSVLEADDLTSKRVNSIKFFESNQPSIEKLATQYEALKPSVQFALSESTAGKLSPDLKDGSIDLILLDLHTVVEQQRTELLANATRILRSGGKLITIGNAINQ